MAVVCTNVVSFRWTGSHAVYKIRCAASGNSWEVERRHRDFAGLSRVANALGVGTVPLWVRP